MMAFLILSTFSSELTGQSNTCVPGMVENGATDPWSEECYLNDNCGLQGNPCNANDVTLVGVFIADSVGGPVPACTIGDTVEVLLWGTFMNNTGTNRYAIRSRVEVFINGMFNVELNTCSFDVLAPGSSDAALIGSFTYVCGQQVSIVNTWVGWSTSASQCSNSGGANYNNVCNEYPPSKCSKDLGELVFLTPNFSYDCGEVTDTTTEVCFTNLTFGGVPPLTYLWEFGDGDTSTLENPCHTYMATSGSFTVVLTATDSNGVMAGAQLTLNLDSLACCNLSILCPSADGGTFECIEDVPDPDPGLITVIDSCSATTITSVDSISGTGCGLDTMFITRYYIIADSVHTDSCIQVFKVVDDLAPVITVCPADVTVECDNLVPAANIALVTATDNCAGMVTVTFGGEVLSDSTCANRYILTRIYIATDACNNSSTCNQVITVFDDTPPTFTFVPANTTVNCNDTPVFGVPTATDNCGDAVTITFTDSSAPAANCAGGTVTRSWTATDVCGNSATASQTLTFVDADPPVFTSVPADATIACDSVPVFGTVTVIDSCDTMVTLDSTTTTAPMANCAGGTTTRTWTATDSCGNTSTASQTFTFIDTVAPVFTFVPMDATIACTAMPAFGTPVVTDNCDTSVALDSVTTVDTISNCAGGTTTRTWTATDNCGNTATASQTLTFMDLVAPTIICPADVTIECDESTLPPNTGTATATDDCGGTPVVTFSDVTVASMICPQEYSITRTWLATDDCDNTATCVQTIIVDDSTPPDLTCPPDVTVDCEDSTAPDSTGFATAIDSCQLDVAITWADSIVPGLCPYEMTILRTWTANDSCGNVSTCLQTIAVQDTTPPVAIFIPPDVTVECDANIDSILAEVPIFEDNCDPDVPAFGSIEFVFNEECPQGPTFIIAWTGVDTCGNSTTVGRTVVVIDTTAPELTCPADLTINCEDSTSPDSTGTATATDNCQEEVVITSADSIIPGECPQEMTILRTWTADDSCGNMSTCLQTITVQDTTPPTFDPVCQAVFRFFTSEGADCPAEATISIMEGDIIGENESWTVGGITVPSLSGCLFDNCTNPDSLVARADSISVTGDSCVRTFTVFFTILDQCGNESVDQFICVVNIHDDEAPIITCPADLTIDCEDSTLPDSTGFATAIDSCQLDVAITWADSIIPGLCPQEMTILRTWTADDSCGNVSTCLQTIAVQDTTPPVAIFVPPDVTVECDANIDSILAEVPIFEDNCDPDVPAFGSIEFIFNEECPQGPTFIIAWTGVDTCGNSTTVGRTVVVIDTTAPELTCPADLTINCEDSTSPDSTGTATATDNCQEEVVITSADSIIPGECPQEMTILRTWTADDSCGNMSTCLQTITVQDTTPPTFDPVCQAVFSFFTSEGADCPAEATISIMEGDTVAENESWTVGGITIPSLSGCLFDNCTNPDSLLARVDSISITGDSCDRTFTVYFTILDQCGNESVDQFICVVNIHDDEAPVITCPADLTIDCEDSTLPDSTGFSTAIDSCQLDVVITWADSIIPGECPQEMTILRTWTADDSCGNVSTCLQTIIVQDITPPTITCPMDVTIQTGEGEFIPAIDFGILTDFALFTAAGAFDNLGPTIVSGDIGTNVGTITGFPPGVVIGQMHAANGVTAQAAADVAVAYGQLVAMTCGTVLGTTLGNGQVLTPDVYCLGAASTVNLNLVLDAQGDPNAVFVFQIDGALSTNALSNVILINGASSCNVYWQVNGAFAAGTNSIFRGNLFAAGAISLNFGAELEGRALSTAGAISTNSNVVNSIAPCSSGEIGMATATDNCGSSILISYSDDVMGGACCGDVIMTRTWRATDECGNSATCAQIITVEDNTPPMITCPTNITVSCEADVPACPTTFAEFDALPGASATDLCDTLFSYSCSTGPLIGGPCGGTITRTHTVTDDCGNSSTCIQTITVDDNIAPVITCPADLTINCEESTSPDSTGFATAIDSCQLDVAITWTDSIIPGLCPQEMTILRTWTADDSCGNVSTCLQTINVQDITPPTITCPMDVTVDCDAFVDLVINGDFETMDFTGWSQINIGDGGIAINDGTFVPPSGDGPFPPCEGGSGAVTFQGGPGTHTLYQDITIPAGVASATLSWTDRIRNHHSEFVDPDQEFRVEVWDPADNSVIAELFSTNPGDPLLNGCLSRAVDLTSYAGQTIRLAFTEQDAFFFFEVHLDAVQVLVGAATASTGIATAEDICDEDVWVTYVDAVVLGECPQESFTTRTWTATDDCGNTSSCIQLITVQDTVAPLITCPADLTINCDESTLPDSIGIASATDNCQDTVEITSTDSIIPGACPQEMTILRTWMAVDSCGNASTCVQSIFVQDTTPPTFNPACQVVFDLFTSEGVDCPAEAMISIMQGDTVGESENWTVGGFTIPSLDGCLFDNCTNPDSLVARVDSIPVTGDSCDRTFTVYFTILDQCGNESVDQFICVVNIHDDEAPIITCPADITINCEDSTLPDSTGFATAIDSCQLDVVITWADSIIPGNCPQEMTILRTWTADDNCDNTSTCLQTIFVQDTTPPTITCPANVTVQCANLVPPVNIGAVVTSDNCSEVITVTHVGDVITNMTCVNRFILTRTYRATDECGNSATCAQVITVFDDTPPTITCPANVTVQCASDVPPINIGSVVASDNCGGTVTITHVSDVVTNMTCLNRFTLTRTYRATDECGNSATCAQVITVYDDTPPVITFDDPLLEGVPNGGTVEVQCFGQDPEWELPMLDEGSVDVTDNCAGTVTVVFTDDLIDEGDCEVDGYINRYLLTWVATDVCGNTSSAFVFLELVDTIPPVIHNVPADITVNCDEIPAPPTDIFATDECLCACIILFDETEPDPGCQDGQILTRTWTAKDDCGNITVAVQNITLTDNEGPEIILMVPELIGADDGSVFEYTCNEGGIPEFFAELNAESVMTPVVCGTLGLVSFEAETIIANNCKFWGYIEKRVYTWEAVDDCGNTTTLTITALLIDTEPPIIVGAPEMTCIGDPALDLVEAVDNCDNASLIYWDVRIPNPCGADEAIMRTYEAYDDCGNTVRDTSILIPNDQSHPEMVFIDPVLAELEFGEILIVECDQQENGQYTPYGPGDVDFIDACMSGVTIVFSENIIEAGDCTEGLVAVIELLWTATDLCGNLGEARIMAHVVDNTSPEFENFEVEITIDCGDELPEVFATDNCGDVVIETIDSIVPGPCVYESDVIRTHTATDPCGNSTVRKQLIHVGDGSGPDIEGVVEEVCDDLSIPEVTAYDPCAGEFVEVTMVQDTLDIPCEEGMIIERIWTAVDACGHVSEVRQLIIIGDQTPPEIQIPTNSIIRRFYGYFDNLVFLSEENIMDQLNDLNGSSVFVLDDCDQEIEAVFNLVVTYSEDCEADGYFERRTYSWIATDICGNSDEVSFTVDIMDDIPPVIIGVPANTIIICEDLPPVPVVTAEDPAQPVEIEYTQIIETGDSPNDFIVTRTWTATDACGNVSQGTQKITWIPDTFLECDIISPGPVVCNTHGVVIGSEISGGLGEITYLWEVVGEDCFIQSGQNTPEIIIYIGWTEVSIMLTVTDAFGCISVCSLTLNCLDPFENNFVIKPQIINPETQVAPTIPENKDTYINTLQHFNLWPNPATSTVTLSFESFVEDEVEYTLTNFLGQIVMSDEMDAIKGYNSRKIDVSLIPDGAYLLQMMTENQVYTKTIIIMRND